MKEKIPPDYAFFPKHIDPEDDSTTIMSRPCAGCGSHQTIAGALLNSKEWSLWKKEVSRRMQGDEPLKDVFDVDECEMIDAMSDEHFKAFIEYVRSSVDK